MKIKYCGITITKLLSFSKNLIISLFLAFLIIGPISDSHAETGGDSALLDIRSGRYRISFDTLTLPGDEEMSLVGGNYLLQLHKNLYAGIAFYGSVSGQRGGFFTGGVESGLYFPLTKYWSLDAGFFAGGGGGGAAPQGGGLMLRPHLDLLYGYGGYRLGLGVNQVRFPNGDINSTQLGLVLEKDFNALFSVSPNQSDILKSMKTWAVRGYGFVDKERRFSVEVLSYKPFSGTLDTQGKIQDGAIGVVGVEWQQFTKDDYYLSLAVHGAMYGDVDGFAQIVAGAGKRYPLAGGHGITAGLKLGAAGGGRVDTGGGFVAGLEAGWYLPLSQSLQLGIKTGLLTAPDGDFSAYTLGLTTSYQYSGVGIVRDRKGSGALKKTSMRKWRWRLANQSYLPYGDTKRKSGDEDDRRVDLIGLMADVMLSEHTYLTGKALGAYNGGAGGYAVGLVGIGRRYSLTGDERLTLAGEFAVGAGGGGGLATGQGFIIQPMVTLGYEITRGLAAEFGLGLLDAPTGSFNARVVHLALSYGFSTPYRSNE